MVETRTVIFDVVAVTLLVASAACLTLTVRSPLAALASPPDLELSNATPFQSPNDTRPWIVIAWLGNRAALISSRLPNPSAPSHLSAAVGDRWPQIRACSYFADPP